MFYLYHNKSSQNHPRQFTEVSSHQSNEIIELIKEIVLDFRNHVLRDKKIMLARLWNRQEYSVLVVLRDTNYLEMRKMLVYFCYLSHFHPSNLFTELLAINIS